ncbi:MAG: DUF1501 domain-containing protein [Gemmataceae bacterium]|nr:DUF1501 domain-containing protein [Gemmataceae bacterium]
MNIPTDNAGMGRRQFLKSAALASLALSAANLNPVQAAPGRARKVIFVWLWGGPSQWDMFDPKPDMPSAQRTPFSTIPTRIPGARFTELLPRLAARSNRFSLIQSNLFGGQHASWPMSGQDEQTARPLEPNFGSIVAKHLGSRHLPPFISIMPAGRSAFAAPFTGQPGVGAGKLGPAFNPFYVKCNILGEIEFPGELTLRKGMTQARLSDRRALLSQLEATRPGMESSSVRSHLHNFETAYRLINSPETFTAFDLSKEREQIRGSYGRSSFGQSLLLGRRLIEAGVPYVQVNWGNNADGLEEGSSMGWDNHYHHNDSMMSYQCPQFDRCLSALLDDLQDRGLFESTLVVAMGEMGRTANINSMGGRDHNAHAFTFWAGGGVQPGRIVAPTNRAGQPTNGWVRASSVGATIAELVGLDTQGRAEMNVLPGAEVVHDLL